MSTARTYKGVAAAERVAQRRRQLLDATLAIWGDVDRPRVTMTGVCQQAGLTERYFYESFVNLDEALVAVLHEVADEIEQRTIAALASAGGAPADRARASIAAFVQILTDDPRKGRVALVESATLEATRAHRGLLLRRFARMSAREARKLYGPDAWGEPEGAFAAAMFVGGVAQLVSSWIDGTLPATPESIIEAATRNFAATAHATRVQGQL